MYRFPPCFAVVAVILASVFSLGNVARSADSPSGTAAAASSRTNSTVLVLIDIQNFYFPGGLMPLVGPEAAGIQASRTLERFRGLGWPVIHVQHLPKDQAQPTPESGDPNYRIHASVRPAAGEVVIGKHHANAFRDTGLLDTLRSMGARRLVIAGMQTHMCVEAATRAAADLGLEVTVLQDACATRALKFKEVEVPAEQVHASTLASLQGGYARVLSTEEFLAQTPMPAGR